MSREILFCIIFVLVCLTECEGITRLNDDERNLIGEEERRGVNIKENTANNEQQKSETQNRGLWIIGQTHKQPYPSGYDSSDIGGGYQGYGGQGGHTTGAGYAGAGGLTGAVGYGITGTGYTYENSGIGYHKGPTYGHHYSPSGGGNNYGYSDNGIHHGGIGANFGHSGSGYDESGHGLSHGNHGYDKKLALKKFLIPLAGLALLGAAAALSTNPVLLQLGTINGRRRRSVFEKSYTHVYPMNPKVTPELTN